MIATDDFLLINFPKTGSSYTREVIKRLYRPGGGALSGLRGVVDRRPVFHEIMLPKIDQERQKGILDQHGTRQQIPARFSHLPIVTVARHPFKRYISNYRYGWWRENPPAPVEEIRAEFPAFPELDFEEFYAMNHRFSRPNRLKEIEPTLELGLHSIQFVQFFARDPRAYLETLTDESLESGDCLLEFDSIRFLDQDDLSGELRALFTSVGFTADDLAFMDTMGRVNESRSTAREEDGKSAAISDEVARLIYRRDRLLFKLFDYPPPAAAASA